MSEKTVRKIFIVILIFLPLQYILVGILGYYKAEPWPAFVFPGFKNVYQIQDHYLIRETRFEFYNPQGEKITSIQPHRFFPELPRSQIAGLMRSLFPAQKEMPEFSPRAKEFFYENSKKVAGQDVGRMEIVHSVDFLESGGDNLVADSTKRELIGVIDFTK